MKSKRKRIFITLSCGITLLCVFAFIYGIGEKPPIAIYTTSSGKEYNILKIYDLKFMDTGEKMLAVQYLSEGPNNEAIGAVVVGLLLIVFRKNFARFAIWYQLRRVKDKPEEHLNRLRSTGSPLIQVYAIIAGIVFMILGILLLSGLFSCIRPLSIIHHSEQMAAKKAVDFVDAAFIHQGYKKGYSLLSKNLRGNLSFQEFERFALESHPRGFPRVVTATAYEPMPGQKAMAIFLHGENENEQFYYRLVMEGTKETNYKVSGIYRSETP